MAIKGERVTKIRSERRRSASRQRSTGRRTRRLNSVTIAGRGVVDVKEVQDGIQIQVYGSLKEAVAAGTPRGLASLVFARKRGTCAAGQCVRFSNLRGGKKFHWCNSQGDVPCETPRTKCECHLIRAWEDPANPGTWKTEDLGRITKAKAVEDDGTSTYFCNCV